MKRSVVVALATSIALIWAIAPSSASQAPVGPGASVAHSGKLQEGCAQTETGYVCHHGPIDVPTGEMVQVDDAFTPPDAAGYLTTMRATLVDANGDPIAHHMVHLHHAVWLNPNKTDSTCSSFGGFPNWDRFFATGKERTKMVLPEGFGYFWDNQPNSFSETPFWGMSAHLDGMHGAEDVFIRLKVDFVPAEEAEGISDIDPYWFDVVNCTMNPVFDVAKGSGKRNIYKKTWSYVMQETGRFISFGGHLHDGGLRLALRNKSTDEGIFTSRAIYGRASEPWYLTKMTSYSGSGFSVSEGDELSLTAVYDSTHRWRDAMGIMVGAFVPSP